MINNYNFQQIKNSKKVKIAIIIQIIGIFLSMIGISKFVSWSIGGVLGLFLLVLMYLGILFIKLPRYERVLSSCFGSLLGIIPAWISTFLFDYKVSHVNVIWQILIMIGFFYTVLMFLICCLVYILIA